MPPPARMPAGDEMLLGDFSRVFPPLGIRTSADSALRSLGVEPKRYAAMGLAFSAAAGLAALASLWLSAHPLALPLAALAAALAFALILLVPRLEMENRKAEIEASLPLFMRSLGMLMEMGLPFRRAMEIAADGCGPLQQEVRRAAREAEEGMSLQRSIAAIALAYRSLPLKRAIAQMLSVYETGGSGREMTKVGDDLLQLEGQRMKEYSARSAVFGLLFIMSSAILPTFYLVYSVAGASGGTDAGLAMLVVFPMLSALSLALSKATMPRSAFGAGPSLDPALLAPGALMAAGFILLPGLGGPVLAAGLGTGILMAWRHYARECRLEEIEERLPDALFCVSGMPRSSGPEMVFAMIERGGFGELSAEAGKSRRQLQMNNRIEAVLDDLWMRNRSQVLKRAAIMLRQMVDTNSLDRMGSLAEDMTRAVQIGRERRSLFAMQKYTLLFGAVLIPAILKIALGLLQGIGGRSGGAASLVPPYLVVYAFIAGMAIGDGEGRASSAASYSVGMAIAGLLAFHFINV